MQKEYVFYAKEALDFPLSDEIETITKPCTTEYLISNSPEAKAVIYAPEINFYLSKTKDDIATKIAIKSHLNKSLCLILQVITAKNAATASIKTMPIIIPIFYLLK